MRDEYISGMEDCMVVVDGLSSQRVRVRRRRSKVKTVLAAVEAACGHTSVYANVHLLDSVYRVTPGGVRRVASWW